MSCGLMAFMCRQCIIPQEIQQEECTRRCIEEHNRHNNQHLSKVSSSKNDKDVYSFKYQTFSKGKKSEKSLLSHSKSSECLSQVKKTMHDQLSIKKDSTIVYCSKNPSVRFSRSPEPFRRIDNLHQMPVKLTFSNNRSNQLHIHKEFQQVSKMHGKRVRTIQQETQYSSKQSQCNFKFSPQNTEGSNFYQTKSINFQKQSNPIIFQEQIQQSLKNTRIHGKINDQNRSYFEYKQQIPSNNQSIMNFYNNPQTYQTIITATQIQSRNQSQIAYQLPCLQYVKENPFNISSLNQCQNYRQIQSINISPRQKYTSPFKKVQIQDYSNIDSNLLYSSKFQNSDYQKVSVLNINQGENINKSRFKAPKQYMETKISALNSIQQSQTSQNLQQQELRDVIDNTFVQSSRNGKNKGISPMISHQSSVKYIKNEDPKMKYVSFKVISPIHSRNTSNQFGLFAKTRANLGRTNTIQSMESAFSQKSLIDVKFMQRVRSRKGVSKLISEKE